MQNKKNGKKGIFFNLEVTPDKERPVQSIKNFPITYYNPILSGNQNILAEENDFKNADDSEIGKAFLSKYGYSYLRHIRLLDMCMKELQQNIMSKDLFVKKINYMNIDGVNGENVYDKLTLNKLDVLSHKKEGEKYIWSIGVNKFRTEIYPFLKLENGEVFTSYYLQEQSLELWYGYYLNGGMLYTGEPKDELQKAFAKKNNCLGEKLVKLLRKKLKHKYVGDFDDIDVGYRKIYGKRKIDYGDFDLIFYNKEINELFLIEAKFMSDSYSSSSIASDYDKIFRPKGYYDKCRRRYDLVISEPDTLKKYIGVTGDINVHFMFVSSKSLDIELQDEDSIVTFIGLEAFENYIDGKFKSEDGTKMVRPMYKL